MTSLDTTFSTRSRILAHALLAALLLILALRLTQAEDIYEPLAQRRATLVAAASTAPADRANAPSTGPNVIAIEATLTFLLAAAAAFLAARHNRLARGRALQFLLITAIGIALTFSTFHAANRFRAVIGEADLAMALAAGWTLALLCALLGDSARRAVIATLVAIAAICIAKSYMQKFIEFPDLAEYLRQHPENLTRYTGIDDPEQARIYQYRMDSREVFAFISFANLLAAALVGMLGALTAVLIAWYRTRAFGIAEKPALPVKNQKSKIKNSDVHKDIPLDLICAILAAILLVAGLAVLPMTDSMGGMLLGFASIAAIIAAAFLHPKIAAHRKKLIALALLAMFLGTAALIGHGLFHDSLPTKSLLFRWHYWTASAPIIRDHSARGVGLNNFGDYYLQTKRPSSPEDVKDPHSYFIRLLAETGIPATLMIAGLLVCCFTKALRPWTDENSDPVEPALEHSKLQTPKTQIKNPLLSAAAVAVAWIVLHLTIAEEPILFNIDMTIIYAILALGSFAITLVLIPRTDQESEMGGGSSHQKSNIPARFIPLSILLAAFAMFIYDQINMALVTGPVAMLFWMLLGLAASYDMPRARPARFTRPLAWLGALCSAAAALALLTLLAIPLVLDRMPWDPRPLENDFIQKSLTTDAPAIRAALDKAIALEPNSLDLLTQKTYLLRDKFPNEPLAPLIRRLFDLDRANAKIRVTFALPDSDLPAPERARALHEALTFDDALPPKELKHLSPETRAEIMRKLQALESR